MEKRIILAVVLMSAAIFITNWLFPPVVEDPPAGDQRPVAESPAIQAPTAPVPPPTPVLRVPREREATAVDTVVVSSPRYRYTLTSRGASVVGAQMLRYPSYTIDGPVQIAAPTPEEFVSYRLVVGTDTLDLRSLPFQPDTRALSLAEDGGEQTVRFRYAGDEGFAMEIAYTFHPERYLAEVEGRITGIPGGAVLVPVIAPGIGVHEAPGHHAERELAVVARRPGRVERQRLDKVGMADTLVGPLTWAGMKDKYFLAVLIPGEAHPFVGGIARALPRGSYPRPRLGDTLQVPQATVMAALTVPPEGGFRFGAYLGPQEKGHLAAVGYDLDELIPYGYRWMRPIMRPIAAAVLTFLDWLHVSLGVGYGWVLVIFGVLVKLILWPLNAKAMRSQMKSAALQPRMQELRERFKDDPQKQQQELMKLMREEGANPLAGCLPMLIPFPVLIALFFVFQGTIAFRGVEFLWLPDLSLPDPYYLLPLVLVASTFLLQWISVKLGGMESNPQMKMMMYILPPFMGFIFMALPAGLNLYYAVSNLAGIPQQILIAVERKRATEAQKAKEKAEKAAAAPPSAARKGAARRSKKKKS
jgi:YidC/Oxa1 family membrane protein insertase